MATMTMEPKSDDERVAALIGTPAVSSLLDTLDLTNAAARRQAERIVAAIRVGRVQPGAAFVAGAADGQLLDQPAMQELREAGRLPAGRPQNDAQGRLPGVAARRRRVLKNYKDRQAKSITLRLGATFSEIDTQFPAEMHGVLEGLLDENPDLQWDGTRLWVTVNGHAKAVPNTRQYLENAVQNVLGHELAAMQSCGTDAIRGVCAAGHEVLKVAHCNREYCPVCGHRGSDMHLRRYARILPKVQQWENMGMFVIQWPVAARVAMRSRAKLMAVGRKITKAFKTWAKRTGQDAFARGLRAWDWFGDARCPKCGLPGELQNAKDQETENYVCQKGHEFTLDDVNETMMKFNPHVNVLVGTGFLPDLAAFKAFLREEFHEPKLIVHYEYAHGNTVEERIPQMLHMARYAVKPTFLRMTWDPALVPVLKGIRSVFYWGKWDGATAWNIDQTPGGEKITAVLDMQANVCPKCRAPLIWQGFAHIPEWSLYEPIGAGYWTRRDPARAGPGRPES